MNMLITSLYRKLYKINSFWFILGLCGFNLLFMHIYILHICHFEAETNFSTWADNLLSISFDVFIVYVICYLLSWRNIKIAAWLCFIVTWLWSFSNIVYSRFFYHYLSASAIEQGGVLTENLIIKCIIDSLQISDLYYPLVAVIFILALKKIRPICIKTLAQKSLIIIFSSLLIDISAHVAYCILNPQYRYISYFTHRLYLQHLASPRGWSQQNLVHFVRGEIRTIFEEIIIDIQGNIKLSDKQIGDIKSASYKAQNSCKVNNSIIYSPTNIIFIIVESYMSFTSDLIVNGKEVTPFLNSLKHKATTYYNGKMCENVTIGESSDGQFIYMTGILPLQSDVTVSRVRRKTLPGLPKVLGRESRMIIPTTTAVWNQDEMCRQYGFQHLYTRDDYRKNIGDDLNDKQVFELAIQKDNSSELPFFSVILTMSMHGPYTDLKDPSFKISDSSLSKDLVCYLNACHYTDNQIEMYFNHLNKTGLLNNSLIIITADHRVHKANFGEVSNYIPLYIVNAKGLPIDMWQGECNQLDVYTTLLDLLGCKSNWYGLGCSLISPSYRNVRSTQTWNISQWIIMSDYFSKQ